MLSCLIVLWPSAAGAVEAGIVPKAYADSVIIHD